MTVLGMATLAKKKTSDQNTPDPAPDKDDRVAVVVLKGSREYREWLNSISKDSLIPVASIVRDAVAKWAVQRGYPGPPEM